MELAVILLPLFGACLAGLLCRLVSVSFAQRVTSGFLILSGILSAVIFYNVVFLEQSYVVEVMRWIESGDFKSSWSMRVDVLTAVMLVVVTWVSAAVHVYSIGYMSHDPHIQRFMSYLSLFTFFMLVLVTSNNFVQLFFGWEGVGLCSYFLIGFWYHKPSANAAAVKAFLVNRVGDFAFALGIFAVYVIFGSVQFDEVFIQAAEKKNEVLTFLGGEYHGLTVVCILLFIGAMGKSAQLGLHTWLPDAMEGPTPVSALIHAATMVTAGVFLVARCSPLFEYSPIALNMVTLVGAATAIFAATVAITQNDIKRIIAYSTCSQLGYMFFACGVSAYSAGIFHLMTHAFFKALLFLGAGSVIHAMSDEHDIRKMGGMWKKIPMTYGLILIGSLALVGVFPFAGFYSKDIVLEAAYASSSQFGHLAYWLGIAAAFLTAFYSWRLIILVFHGKSRASDEVLSHVHECPKVMMYPLCFLALGAIFSGINGYHILHMVEATGEFWQESIVVLADPNPLEGAHHIHGIIKWLPSIVGIVGILLAYVCYMFYPKLPGRIVSIFPPLYKFLHNKWYFDELYDFLFVRPAKRVGSFLWNIGDVRIVDGLGPNGLAWVTNKFALRVSKFQSGYIYTYATVMLLGLLGLVGWYIYLDGV